MADGRKLAEAGGVFLVTRQILDPAYKPEVYRDDQQRLAFLRMVAMARWSNRGGLRRGQVKASVRQLADRCGLTRSTMGALLQRLERDGAIERIRGRGHLHEPDVITLRSYDDWQDALGRGLGRDPDAPSDAVSDAERGSTAPIRAGASDAVSDGVSDATRTRSRTSTNEGSTNEEPSTHLSAHTQADTREGEPDDLRSYLGDHAAVVDRMDAVPGQPSGWAASVCMEFGPGGINLGVWGGVPPPERPAILATALSRYAGEDRQYKGNLFRAFLRTAIDERTNGSNRTHGGRAPGEGGAEASRDDEYAHLGG